MFDDVKVSFVKSVKVSRIVKTFDIEVDSDEHAFIAKGVGGGVGISHNSAMISLSNLSDERMRYAKSGEWWVESIQRRLANNSAAYTEKPEIGTFLREFLSLYESKSGERGMFNRQSAITHAAKYGRILPDDVGLNPCCFTGDMRLLTENGYKTFEELSLSSSVNIVEPNGTVTKGFVWSSGEKEVVDVIFQNGRKAIRCTADHRFMLNDGSECEAKDLKGKRLKRYVAIKDEFNKEDILAGYMLGDANLCRIDSDTHLGLEVFFGEKDGDVAEMFGEKADTIWYSRFAMEVALKYDLPSVKIGQRGYNGDIRLLSGLYSANGCVISGHRVALKGIDREQIDNVCSTLATMGIESYVTTNKPKTVLFSNGAYECKESYDLNISKYESIVRFAENISFVQKYKRDSLQDLLDKRAPHVRSVKPVGVAEVFDFTEPKTHWGVVEGFVVHNSEILLRPGQFCNLTAACTRPEDDFESLKEKIRLATIIGTIQATQTNFSYLSPIWKENCEEERLLGVSIPGVMDHPVLQNTSDEAKKWLDELSQYVIEVNKEWAKLLNINPAAASRCQKPAGNSGELYNVSSGLHTRFAPYYIRRVRADAKDPLAIVMKQQGFHCEDDITQPGSWVFSFPVKAPEQAVFRDDRTAIEQLEYWLMWRQHWTDHNPSVTIYVKEHEWMEVGNFVWKHFDEICGISFLPHSDHTYMQAPYEEITKEEYEEMLKVTPTFIDYDALQQLETTDHTTSMQEPACSAGGCELI